ncbi:tRNA (uracil(54)-C(5))-methyltransferase [Sporobolomyces koalae]|uniref:tRNA (uracil(54)-C(5))-methyltransferase n=1 Tax=Sporobolomyces koalae TaxID=500713 RepID=UPI00316CBEA8
MSTATSNEGKRAHSPAPAVPSTSSATSPASKRVKLATEETAPVVATEASPLSVKQNRKIAGRSANNNNQHQKGGRKSKVKAPKPGGVEEAGAFDVIELLGQARVNELQQLEREEGKDWRKAAELEWGIGATGKDVEVKIVSINSHGDGLGVLTPSGSDKPTRLVSVPFTLPGELVKIHVHRHEPEYYMSHGDLLEIIERSEKRDAPASSEELPSYAAMSDEAKAQLKAVREKFGNRVQCRYFGTCSGCQYQPLAYEEQLELKRNVVRRAFANFSKLDPSLVPEIGPTLSSPLEYGYRTKLTPHFQVPPSSTNQHNKKNRRKEKAKDETAVEPVEEDGPKKDWEITIGFEQKGRKRIVDIEECVIATKIINDHMVGEREKVKNNIAAYKRGATLLLRDTLPPRSAEQTAKPADYAPSTENHVCITDHHATVREQVGPNEFEQQAGSFFQNNNSILPSLLDYIKDAVGVKPSGSDDASKTYLVDAYCGSGLFAISLADQFDRIEGVEIDKASIKWAKKNAEYNKGPGRGEIGFRDGKAEAIFGDISFPPDQTTVLIDPPRKGCDELFLQQLLKLSPATIIYVSCNPNTQARDIGYMVRESAKKVEQEGSGKKGYWIESARAADLFSQTHHAEGVAILRREL